MPSEPMSSQEFIKALLSPKREGQSDPYEIIIQLPIDPHHRVADIGCGPGFFSLPLAKYLAFGKLYALDIEDEMLEVLRERVAAGRLDNVEILKSGETEFPLPEASVDGLLLAFVVHQNQDRPAFLKAVAGLLKPNGWCCVLEWYRKDTDEGPPLEKRIDPDELSALAAEAGLRLRRRRGVNDEQYMLLFNK